ncbi:MAG TPA: nucleoside monophosphate kinase [Candidatus Eisenbacteria bacterium]|jgi:adenylate kinase|nr:nucleoside monophosphate kinase [Candidatus Eisenbacteria bacterium]
MKYQTLLLFGAPGSGKGTQGKILGTIPNFFHMACGDVFRHLSLDSEIGRIFIEYSSKGKLVPDEPTVRLWREQLDAAIRTGRFNPEQDTLVLDGIPRNLHQAEMLNDTLNVRGVFNLSCEDSEKLIQRLQRRALRDNRLDDANLDVIRRRMVTYEQESRPVLDYYGQKLVHLIDATQPPHRVLRDILNISDTF